MASREGLDVAWGGLARLLGEPRPFPQELDPTTLEELARVHRLDASLGDASLSTLPAKLPSALQRQWRAAHVAALAQAVHRHARIKEALAALAPTPVILTKGFPASELLYPSPGARSMGDVDVLVPAEALEECLTRLAPLGYHKEFPGHPVWDHPDFHERQLLGPIDLDLHQAFIQTFRLPIDYGAIFERSVAWSAFAPNARLLAPEDAVAYSALRLALGQFTPLWSPAIGYLDLREMLRRRGAFWGFGPPLDIRLVPVRLRQWHAERMGFVVFEVLRQLFPSSAAAATACAPPLGPALQAALRRLIVARAVPPPLETPHRAEVLARKALLLRPTDRLRFAVRELRQRWQARF